MRSVSEYRVSPRHIRWLAVLLVFWTINSEADDSLEALDIECEVEGVCDGVSGMYGPNEAIWRVQLQDALKRGVKPQKPTLGPPDAESTPAAVSGLATQPSQDTRDAKPAPSPEVDDKKTVQPKKKAASWPRSVSIGKPFNGWLAHGVMLKDSPRLKTRAKKNYGTQEMVDAIVEAVDAVHAKHPNTPRLPIGNLSRKGGGRFPPHKSHQNGRDADIGYYLRKGHSERRLKLANRRTMDTPRVWTFLESLIADNKVQYIFSDRRLIRALHRHARDVEKVPKEKLDKIFPYSKGPGIIRHLRGHADHLHIRFHAPESQAAVKEFVRRNGPNALKPVPRYAKVRRGDSLWKLARRHKVSVKKLRRWNRMRRRSHLKPGQKLVVGWRRPKMP